MISLHLGQCGIQTGVAFWNLNCLGQDVQPDGTILSLSPIDDASTPSNVECKFFSQISSGKYVPRSIFADVGTGAIDKVSQSAFGEIYRSDQFVHGEEHCSSDLSRGCHDSGKACIDTLMDCIRKQAENCGNLDGFMIYQASGGCSSVGLGNLMYEQISAEFLKKKKVSISVISSALASSLVEPYNHILTVHSLLEYADLAIVYDNRSIFNICQSQLGLVNASYANVNNIIAKSVYNITRPLCYSRNHPHSTIEEMVKILVPYPRVNLVTTSMSPIHPVEQGHDYRKYTCLELTTLCYPRFFNLSGCDLLSSKVMAVSVVAIGDFIPRDFGQGWCMRSKEHVKFVDWTPTGFHVENIYRKPMSIAELALTDREHTILSNGCCMREPLQHMEEQFDALFARKAHTRWFVEGGMEESELQTARDDVAQLQQDYVAVAEDTTEGEEDFEEF